MTFYSTTSTQTLFVTRQEALDLFSAENNKRFKVEMERTGRTIRGRNGIEDEYRVKLFEKSNYGRTQ